MSVLARPRGGEAPAAPAELGLADRLLAAVPLASIYVWLSIVYCVEAWKRVTPWLFSDELELTQLARSIAATGHPARRGEPYTFRSLYPVLTAPLWLIHDVGTAFAAVKYVDVFAMTSVVFPTYFLARMLVPRGWALFAAAGAGAIPSLAYSSWIVEETFAYPYAVLCFLLLTKALVHRSRGWIVAAAVTGVVAPAVRGELVVIPITAFLAASFALWSSERGRAVRSRWSRSDYVGFFVLVAGAIIFVSGLASRHSLQWYAVTQYYKHRIVVLGDWAAGSLAIGLGVVPFVLGVAALVPGRGEERRPELRFFRCVAVGAVIAFGLYTAMKAAWLSTTFATRNEERNLIYVAPLLFVGTALVLHRRRVSLLALAAAAAYTLYLLVGTPFRMDTQLYSDALGLAILQQANRYYELTTSAAQWLLLGVLGGGVAVTLAVVAMRARVVLATATAALLAIGVLAWNVTGEISAAAGNVSIARSSQASLGHPFSWVDAHADGKPTLYLAQSFGDPIPEWLLEFWNRSISAVSSLDGEIQPPGPSGAPNIAADGRVYWTQHLGAPGDRVFDYAVEDWPCIDFAGTLVASHLYGTGTLEKPWRLVRLTKPNRLRSICSGIYADGWTGSTDSSYFRFTRGKPGWLRISLSRQSWPSSPVHVQLGSIATKDNKPVLGELQDSRRYLVRSRKTTVVYLRAPAHPFGVRVVVDRKFVPRQLNPQSSDPRLLGVLISYRFVTRRPSA